MLGKTNWLDSTIQRIIGNELYKGDFVNGKRSKKPTYYENVVEPLISKEKWENCQSQKKRNARHYERTATYLFTNKLKFSTCGRFLGGCATTKQRTGKELEYQKRNFDADKPNEKWYTDVTEFNLRGNKLYLSPILDGFNQEVISYNISTSANLAQIDDNEKFLWNSKNRNVL